MLRDDLLEKKSGCPVAETSIGAAELQENLRRLDRLANLGLVSASIAHEIKNGLVSINVFLELLLQKGDDQEMTEVVRRELKRIDGLVTQMLRFAAPKPKSFAAVPIHELIDRSLRLLEHQMHGRMITVERHYRATSDSLRADESQLQQVFMNLFLNAVEAVGNNGELTITTEDVTGADGTPRLKISIHDTGMGITPENLARLFEPFFTTKKNGTGLGLSITRRIVEEHRGMIEVASQPGKGSTFILSMLME
ncbi:MAG TPA: ATP-binding protein [Verrucomicrobiae bacterium]|jgi:two-component system sensor histidine kinase HydH